MCIIVALTNVCMYACVTDNRKRCPHRNQEPRLPIGAFAISYAAHTSLSSSPSSAVWYILNVRKNKFQILYGIAIELVLLPQGWNTNTRSVSKYKQIQRTHNWKRLCNNSASDRYKLCTTTIVHRCIRVNRARKHKWREFTQLHLHPWAHDVFVVVHNNFYLSTVLLYTRCERLGCAYVESICIFKSIVY